MKNIYKGKKVTLNKPTKGDRKKYKIFVKDPQTGNIKKVEFGDPNMEIKRDNPERRKAFRARHNCDNPGPKTKPRYWSCKFWSKTPVSKLLETIEGITKNTIDFEHLKIKETLHPKIWDFDVLNHKVKNILLKTVKRFLDYLDLDQKINIKDIVLTGSIANYNWHKNSDIDLHIVLDFKNLGGDEEVISELLRIKSKNWNEKTNIKLFGHDVELYFQDVDDKHSSQGIYSLINDDWVNKPMKKMIIIDKNKIAEKAGKIMSVIDDIENSEKDKINLIDKIKDKIISINILTPNL